MSDLKSYFSELNQKQSDYFNEELPCRLNLENRNSCY